MSALLLRHLYGEFTHRLYPFFGEMSSDGPGRGVHDAAPVQIAPGQAQHQHLGGGDVAGEGDVVLVAEAGDVGDLSGHLLVVGIVEEQHQIEFVIGDAGADLLAAAVGVGQEAVDLQTGGVGSWVRGSHGQGGRSAG